MLSGQTQLVHRKGRQLCNPAPQLVTSENDPVSQFIQKGIIDEGNVRSVLRRLNYDDDEIEEIIAEIRRRLESDEREG